MPSGSTGTALHPGSRWAPRHAAGTTSEPLAAGSHPHDEPHITCNATQGPAAPHGHSAPARHAGCCHRHGRAQAEAGAVGAPRLKHQSSARAPAPPGSQSRPPPCREALGPSPGAAGRIQFSSPFRLRGGPGMFSRTSLASWDFFTITSLSFTAVCILLTLDWFLGRRHTWAQGWARQPHAGPQGAGGPAGGGRTRLRHELQAQQALPGTATGGAKPAPVSASCGAVLGVPALPARAHGAALVHRAHEQLPVPPP